MPDQLKPWRRARHLTVAAAVTLALALPGTIADAKVPPQMGREELFGTVLKKSRWPSNNVAVCWENPDGTSPPYRAVVRDAVLATWGKVTKPGTTAPILTFSGWDSTCVEHQDGVHILIASGQPHTLAVGKYLNTRTNGMSLTFDIADWRPSCKADPIFCIKAVAVHEFGHALGFTHEQKLPNKPAECAQEPDDIIGDYLVTDYDLSSVMALCNSQWNGNGQLSALDREALIRFYA